MMNSVRIPQMEVVMLENYFAKPSTIDRIRAHWLAPQIERYVEWMQTNGYADRNIISRVPYLCHFADFTERRGTADLNSAAAQVEEFASHWVATYQARAGSDRKSTRLNSSHMSISYAVFCLKKKKK